MYQVCIKYVSSFTHKSISLHKKIKDQLNYSTIHSEWGHEKIIMQLQKQVKQLTALIEKLVESNKDLQKRLSYYENPHSSPTPSKNSLK